MNEEQLFLEAISRPPHERAAFLDRACADQPELRRAVDALLAAHDEPGHPLDEPPIRVESADPEETVDSAHGGGVPVATGEHTPDSALQASGPTSDYSPAAAPGRVIAGRYTLAEKIGEGGMGEVWVARQTEPVKRRVALKLIKTGMDSKAVVTRFEQERQALAMMDHPHIARVLDGGLTDDRRPFFVMELVNGLSLVHFCDEARLTPRQRLELFVPVCQAVQHAHQKGIVHRDLKPSNILVTMIDGRPVPKVIDFGVAKATAGRLIDDSLTTQFGAVVGTLEYMSPEQAGYSGQDVDTRADIYSLGVILYELLTGLKPHDGNRLRRAALTEMIRILHEEEPSRPSTRLSTHESLPSLAAVRQIEPKRLAALLRGELDWIVMKCLEKQRDRRYETASGLARDIERFLSDEPVEARPPSARYRLGKFLRRHKGPVAAACLVAAALVAGICGTTIGLVEARKQTALKETARKDEAQQRLLAEQANLQAYEALKSFTDELMEKVLGGRSQLTDNEKAILRSAEKQWEVFARSKGDSKDARVIRADGAENLALVQARLGLNGDAEVNHRLALSIRSRLAAEFPEVARYRLVWARSHQNLGSVLRGKGLSADAEAEFRQAIAIFERLAADFPAEPEYCLRLANSHLSLANACRDRGDFAASDEHYRKSLALSEVLVADHPDSIEYRHTLERSYWGLAFLSKRMDRLAASEDYYRKAIEHSDSLASRLPEDTTHQDDSGNLRRELGNLLSDGGNPAAAVPVFVRANEIQETLAADFPSMPLYRVALGRSLRDHGRALLRLGRDEDARNLLVRAQGGFERLVSEDPTNLRHQSDLGLTLLFRGDLEARGDDPVAGLPWYDRALEIYTGILNVTPNAVLERNSVAQGHAARANALDRAGRPAEALSDWDKSLEVAPPNRIPMYRVQRALSLLRLDRTEEATSGANLAFEEASRAAIPHSDSWYQFARFFAVASVKVPSMGQAYLERAMESLQKAVAAGFKDLRHLSKDTDLDPLRGREDFATLISTLRVQSAPEPPPEP
jgi:tetratricopeptide (TPR) repeat protein/tRNA A-37 threonylcarbamoyl transferase component Bud32